MKLIKNTDSLIENLNKGFSIYELSYVNNVKHPIKWDDGKGNVYITLKIPEKILNSPEPTDEIENKINLAQHAISKNEKKQIY